MDRHLARKAVAARFLAFATQSGLVAKVDIDRIDRLDFRGRRRPEAKRTREPVRIEEISVGVPIGLGAELGRQILRAQVSAASLWLAPG